jgi:ubiquinone/menaquinone biosynthesis C-methylase UbiE
VSDPFASYRYSFETVAEQYERNRPPYADEAVAWVAERLGIVPGSRVLDLAAGTGKLTRQLLALGAEVVAVEPGDEMRAVLERVLPDVEALAGVAEAIPLPDASVDAVAVGQAFHWFDHDAALAEIRRVLRPGGGLGLLWNRWDEADPLLAAVDELLRVARPPIAERRDLGCRVEERTFHQRRPLSIDQIVGWASSTSGWVNSPREEQERLEREIRRLGEGYAGEVSIATTAIVALS